LGDWLPVDGSSSQEMRLDQEAEGRRILRIVAGPATSASWRTKVVLSQGQYQFQGLARVEGVEPLPFGKTQGAGLRVSGRTRASCSLVGNTPWRELTSRFSVHGLMEEVELVCELRAGRGEAEFDAESLYLVRID